MASKPNFVEVAALLEKCSRDAINAEEVEKRLVVFNYDDVESLINDAIHCLSHFVTDSDIRRKDSEYDDYLRKRLRDYAARIRNLAIEI